MPKFDENIEKAISKIVVEEEYRREKNLRGTADVEYEGFIDLLDSVRTEKDYDWMSDVRLPEFTGHMLTQAAQDAAQGFQTRDFVECYVMDESEENLRAAAAARECLNRTLNQRHLYHYPKYIRAKMINHIGGQVYARCWWEQKIENKVMAEYDDIEQLDIDVFGEPIRYEDQVPMTRNVRRELKMDVPVTDRFNYEIIDRRNVFFDRSYVYSLQEKKWVSFIIEMDKQDILDQAEINNFFNLDELGDEPGQMKAPTQTETSRRTQDKDEPQRLSTNKDTYRPYDVLFRYGKFPCKVNSRDAEGRPTGIEPFVEDSGIAKEDAEWVEAVIVHAMSDSKKVLIGFDANTYRDSEGNSFRPILRGICYVHPTKDEGFGDGKNDRELQVAIDDTFNISQDRTRLATMPTFVTTKTEAEYNDSMFFEPGHAMELNSVGNFKEFKISDNIQGATVQLAMLRNMMQQTDAIHPPMMGTLPEMASTTATAFAGTERHGNLRGNLKSLTFEYTFLTELYWMILQMTWQFAKAETGFKLMGEKLYDFDPALDYYYKPLTQSIETEYSKTTKLKILQAMLGYAVNIPHPDMPKLVNEIIYRIFILLGDEAASVAKNYLDPNKPMLAKTGSQATGPGGQALMPTSNEYGVPQSTGEQTARGEMIQ